MKKSIPLWHIVGVGAVGTIIAANFCRGQQLVQLIVKNEQQLEEYQKTGLSINMADYHFTCHPPALYIDAKLSSIPFLICCTKVYDVVAALQNLEPYLKAESIIILIHNGMGVLEEIKTKWPHLRIISGVTSIGGYLEKPYNAKAFLNGSISIGATQGHFSVAEIKTVLTAFKKSFFECHWTDSIEFLIWKKFAINCCINILTVVLSCKNGTLLQHRELLERVAQEVALVVHAYNIPFSLGELLQMLYEVVHATADNYSSMYKDVQHHRRTEIDYINGRLIQLAKQKNIETPVNDDLLKQFNSLITY